MGGKQNLGACVLIIALAAMLLMPPDVVAKANGSGYDLSWWTIDGGGITDNRGEGGYSLGGTAGQPDAARWSGGGYTLVGGFWVGAMVEYAIYLPLVLR
jgi:hypothetical protein